MLSSRFGRRARSTRSARLIPGTVLLVTDLHSDFLPGGPLAAAGAGAMAERLIEVCNEGGSDGHAYRWVRTVVEGSFFGQGADHSLAAGWPEHGRAAGRHGIPTAVEARRSNLPIRARRSSFGVWEARTQAVDNRRLAEDGVTRAAAGVRGVTLPGARREGAATGCRVPQGVVEPGVGPQRSSMAISERVGAFTMGWCGPRSRGSAGRGGGVGRRRW